jgi:hypothetical protein
MTKLMTAAEFAIAVNDAAARAGDDATFGRRKVFIVALWRADFNDMTLGEFKRRLVAAHRAGAVVLCRADLPQAMDARLVAASEIDDSVSTYHFVIRNSVASFL